MVRIHRQFPCRPAVPVNRPPKRIVHTTPFQISDEELDLYDQLTRYVEDQSIKAAREDSARGRAVGFTMAMLQRRFASSIYAVRRTLCG